MAYQVLIRRKAQKQLDKIQEQHREWIIGDVFALAEIHARRDAASCEAGRSGASESETTGRSTR